MTLKRLKVEGEQDRIVMALMTPTNVLLTAQPGYRADGKQDFSPLFWHTWTPQICSATRVLSQTEVDRLRAGKSIFPGYQPLSSKSATIFKVSFKGVSAGLDTLAQWKLRKNFEIVHVTSRTVTKLANIGTTRSRIRIYIFKGERGRWGGSDPWRRYRNSPLFMAHFSTSSATKDIPSVDHISRTSVISRFLTGGKSVLRKIPLAPTPETS